MFECILVPLDGSRTAEHALRYVHKLAPPSPGRGIRLVLARLVDTPLTETGYAVTQAVLEEEIGITRSYLKGIGDELRAAGYEVCEMTRISERVSGILAIADEQRTELIVMTSHGRTSEGSVAERVSRYARCPVLISGRAVGSSRARLASGSPVTLARG